MSADITQETWNGDSKEQEIETLVSDKKELKNI